jgi:hypothetical protein
MSIGLVVVSIGNTTEHDNIPNNKENVTTRELFSQDAGRQNKTKQYSSPKNDKKDMIS